MKVEMIKDMFTTQIYIWIKHTSVNCYSYCFILHILWPRVWDELKRDQLTFSTNVSKYAHTKKVILTKLFVPMFSILY